MNNYQFHVRTFAGLVTEQGPYFADAGFYNLERAAAYAEFMDQADQLNFVHVFDVSGATVGVVNKRTGKFVKMNGSWVTEEGRELTLTRKADRVGRDMVGLVA